ncbi:MAG: c-type cytochrome biogenesis protein CcsB [bacterium]
MHQLVSTFFGISTLLYLLAMVVYISYIFFKNKVVGSIATGITIIGLIIHTAALTLRTVESYQLGIFQPPFTSGYSSMVFFPWAIIFVYLIIEFIYKQKVIGAVVTPVAFLCLASASLLFPTKIESLVPALQSNWLIGHVVTCFLGYAAFAVAFGISILYLIKANIEKNGQIKEVNSSLPSSVVLDDLSYKAIAIGYPLLTIGIITGAAWAHRAWGRYWGWDPKETWSLITWFIYTGYLHVRYSKGWHGKTMAIFSILGFLAVLFTYFGVNLLLRGLHSYA